MLKQMETKFGSNETLTLKQLTAKTAILLSLTIIMRSSDIEKISYETIQFSPGKVEFTVILPKEAKMRRRFNTTDKRILSRRCTVKENEGKKAICPVHTLRYYIRTTESRRTQSSADSLLLFVTDRRKDAPLGAQRISKLMMEMLHDCGVSDTYKAHSIRMSAASHLIDIDYTIDEVMALGNWSSRATFQKFYDRSQRRQVATDINDFT